MPVDRLLSKRNVWMGLAIAWIVYYHSGLNSSFIPFRALKMAGYGGVDIFIFASGLGCWYSLHRSAALLPFLKRRALRLLPIYYAALPFWLLAMALTKTALSFPDVLGNLLCVQWLTGRPRSVNWYVSAIWLYYLAAPYLYRITQKGRKVRLGALALTILLTVPFFDTEFVVAPPRLALFYMGMLTARLTYGGAVGKAALRTAFALTLLGSALLLVFNRFCNDWFYYKALAWYPFYLITPGLCAGISLAALRLEKRKPGALLLRALELCGRHSFEILLAQLAVFQVVYDRIAHAGLPDTNGVWALALLLTAALSAVIALLAQPLKAWAEKGRRG